MNTETDMRAHTHTHLNLAEFENNVSLRDDKVLYINKKVTLT